MNREQIDDVARQFVLHVCTSVLFFGGGIRSTQYVFFLFCFGSIIYQSIKYCVFLFVCLCFKSAPLPFTGRHAAFTLMVIIVLLSTILTVKILDMT